MELCLHVAYDITPKYIMGNYAKYRDPDNNYMDFIKKISTC